MKKIRLTESQFKRVIYNSIRKILSESRGRKPSKAYYVASFGNEECDIHFVDRVYNYLKHDEISADEAIKMIMDRLYMSSHNDNCSSHKEPVTGTFFGYDHDREYFLTYDKGEKVFDIWKSDDDRGRRQIDTWDNENDFIY